MSCTKSSAAVFSWRTSRRKKKASLDWDIVDRRYVLKDPRPPKDLLALAADVYAVRIRAISRTTQSLNSHTAIFLVLLYEELCKHLV